MFLKLLTCFPSVFGQLVGKFLTRFLARCLTRLLARVSTRVCGEGKNHKYSVQYYPALRKNIGKTQKIHQTIPKIVKALDIPVKNSLNKKI